MVTEISYICKRTVVSTKPVEAGKYYPLSNLDHSMEKNHIKMVYYYQTSSREGKFGELTKKLRESLSETLTNFPMVTGRLVRDEERGKWKVKCNDAGVRMVEAKVKGSVGEWLRNVNREKEVMLVHWEEMSHKSYYWSTFYVQLTEFEEGGLAIGLSCAHLLADTICATNFIKTWAEVSLGNKMISPPILHPLPPQKPTNKNPNQKPYIELINHYKSLIEKPLPINKAKYTTISLGFNDHMVKACMSMAQNPNGEPSPTTPFEALAGLFWASISKIKGIKNGLVDLSICFDARKLLGLDHGFFGNCMIYNKVHAIGFGEEDNTLFPQATRAIGDVVKMDNEGIIDLIEWLESNDTIDSLSMINGHDLIIANLEGNMNPNLTMFQDGFKPLRVSCYIEPVLGEGQVLILPTPSGEGSLSRVVMVTLKEEEAIKLCEDDLISQFSPTILMKI